MYVSMKPAKEWTSVKCFLFLFFVKVIAPQPTGSGGPLIRNTETTQPIHGEKNEMTQVVQVITHENKKNGVALT